MSRHEKEILTDTHRHTYAWGYDNPMQEYFFHHYKLPINPPSEEEEEEDTILFALSSYTTIVPHPSTPQKWEYCNSEIVELMKSEARVMRCEIVPGEHIALIQLDLPIPQQEPHPSQLY